MHGYVALLDTTIGGGGMTEPARRARALLDAAIDEMLGRRHD